MPGKGLSMASTLSNSFKILFQLKKQCPDFCVLNAESYQISEDRKFMTIVISVLISLLASWCIRITTKDLH